MSEEKVKASRFGMLPVTKLDGLGIRPRGSEGQGPQTVPGRMLASNIEAVSVKYDALKADVQKAKDSGLWVMTLDPKRVHAGDLADRHNLSLDANDPKLLELKRSLVRDGQIQPISVRALKARPDEYEIVSGHRRHAAALQLDAETEGGFPIRAVLDGGAGDAALRALRMYVENAARMDLSPYELGQAFRRWIDDGLFADQQTLATATELSKGSVSKYLSLAALPEPVIQAFRDPRAISLRWVEQISAALKEHRVAVLAAATKLSADTEASAPEDVLRALLAAGSSQKPAKAVKTESVSFRGRTLYKIAARGTGLQIKFGAKLSPESARVAQEKVKQVLTEYLSEVQKDAKA